jgi:hypothetical protein
MGRVAKQRYGKFGGGRIELNQKEIQEQVDVIIQAFLAFPVNLRRKHIGAALRRACTNKYETEQTVKSPSKGRVQSGSLAYAYVQEAKKFDKTRQKYGSKYKTYTRKNGKSYTRRIPNALQNSVGATKIFPGYPRDSAVECKIGYMRTGAKRGHVAMLLDEGTNARYRKIDASKAGDFEAKAILLRNKRSSTLKVYRSGKNKGKRKWKVSEPGEAKVKAVRRTKPGQTITAKQSARGFELNAKIMRGKQSKRNLGQRPGYTGNITPSPIQSTALSKIKSMGQKILPQELLNALKAAGKEVASPKYQAMMRKYARKYGGGRILQQMNSQYGIFSTRTK